MAEVYVIASGTLRSLEQWQNDLLAQFMPVYKDGKPLVNENGELTMRRLIVAPIQLYKIVTAKENIPALTTFLGGADYTQKRYGWIGRGIRWFRKFAKLKPLPKPKTINPLLAPNLVDKAVNIMPIGVKDDIMYKGEEQI